MAIPVAPLGTAPSVSLPRPIVYQSEPSLFERVAEMALGQAASRGVGAAFRGLGFATPEEEALQARIEQMATQDALARKGFEFEQDKFAQTFPLQQQEADDRSKLAALQADDLAFRQEQALRDYQLNREEFGLQRMNTESLIEARNQGNMLAAQELALREQEQLLNRENVESQIAARDAGVSQADQQLDLQKQALQQQMWQRVMDNVNTMMDRTAQERLNNAMIESYGAGAERQRVDAAMGQAELDAFESSQMREAATEAARGMAATPEAQAQVASRIMHYMVNVTDGDLPTAMELAREEFAPTASGSNPPPAPAQSQVPFINDLQQFGNALNGQVLDGPFEGRFLPSYFTSRPAQGIELPGPTAPLAWLLNAGLNAVQPNEDERRRLDEILYR